MPYQVLDHDTVLARGGDGSHDEVLAAALGAMEDDGQVLVTVVPTDDGPRYVFRSGEHDRRISNTR